MRVYQLLTVSFHVLGFAVVACSSPAEPAGGLSQRDSKGSGDDGKSESKTSSSSGSTASKKTTPSNSNTIASDSGAPVDLEACRAKCEALSGDTKAAVAAERAIDKKYQECECAPTRCGTECKTDVCASADPNADARDAACQACLDSEKTDDCDTQTKADYDTNEATPGYLAYEQCTVKASCEEGDDNDDDDDDNAANP